MNLLSAAELKRRGMAAIEEGLLRGPLHLVKRNKTTAIVLSEQDYARLTPNKGDKRTGITAIQWLLNQPVTGTKRKVQLDKTLRTERESWR